MKHEFNLHTIAHGIEIVQSHFPGWKFHAVDTIADSALHATLLVGEPQYVNRLGPRVTSDLERFAITLPCHATAMCASEGGVLTRLAVRWWPSRI